MERRTTRGACVLAACVLAAAYLAALAVLSGCSVSAATGDGVRSPRTAVPREGTTPVALEFLRVWENTAAEAYFPFEGLAACTYTDDGTLVVCDEKRGKVHGLDSGNLRWYEFDLPGARPYRPVDVGVDGFKVLVLDRGAAALYRFDLNGTYHDRVLDVANVDPAVHADPFAFAVDRDGRMVIVDRAEQDLILLDTFLEPTMRLGEPGVFEDQFTDPSGIVFLPDGSIVATDQGNQRLAIYGRLGFFENVVGGDLDPRNPFRAPQGLDADRFGNLFVADPGSGRVHVLDRRQRLLFSSGEEFPVAGILEGPVDVAVGPDNRLAVTDRMRSAVLIYRIVYE